MRPYHIDEVLITPRQLEQRVDAVAREIDTPRLRLPPHGGGLDEIAQQAHKGTAQCAELQKVKAQYVADVSFRQYTAE